MDWACRCVWLMKRGVVRGEDEAATQACVIVLVAAPAAAGLKTPVSRNSMLAPCQQDHPLMYQHSPAVSFRLQWPSGSQTWQPGSSHTTPVCLLA